MQPPPMPLPTPPIPLEAIRGAVREEMAAAHQAVAQTAVRAAAEAVIVARTMGLHAALHAVATLLAIRFLLLLAVAGGFVLALLALRAGTYQADGVLAAYAVLIVLPLVALERSPRVEKPHAAA